MLSTRQRRFKHRRLGGEAEQVPGKDVLQLKDGIWEVERTALVS